jgi:hypothetical protein
MMEQGSMGPMGPTGPFGNGGYGYELFSVLALILLVVVFTSVYFLWSKQRGVNGPRDVSESSYKVEDSIDDQSNGSGTRLEVTLRLLNDNEREVVEAILSNGGSVLQKDLTYHLGYSRVKTHRVLQGLLKRGIVSLEEYHNTNKVTLAGWLIE